LTELGRTWLAGVDRQSRTGLLFFIMLFISGECNFVVVVVVVVVVNEVKPSFENKNKKKTRKHLV